MKTKAIYSEMGSLIRAERKKLGITQEELGERVGLKRTSITNIERGTQKIQVHILYAIAEALGVSASSLLPQAPPPGGRELLGRTKKKLPPDAHEFTKKVLTS